MIGRCKICNAPDALNHDCMAESEWLILPCVFCSEETWVGHIDPVSEEPIPICDTCVKRIERFEAKIDNKLKGPLLG